MVHRLISWSLHNRFVVLLISAGLLAWGLFSIKQNPVDAIPDLSENQVIVFTEWMGRSPQVMENQVTYPLVSNLQGIPKIKNIRGTSMFGMSFVYIIFDDNVDIYWARTRVLERLNYAQRMLPPGVNPALGPDGTGVGHILWYHLDAPKTDLGEQRALQDWYIKFALQTVPGVAEIASFGGFEKQFQLQVDPGKLRYYNISFMDVMSKVKENNNEVGGRKFEMSDMAYIIRGLGYLKSISDIENIAITNFKGIPVRVKDIGTVQMGGDTRLGIFDENGRGEVVGGIVVMRYGENADRVIRAVKDKMKEVEKGLPPGVKFKISYDRSTLIDEAIQSVKGTLIEEIITVSLVVFVFLFNWRSALIIIIQLPISVATGFILLQAFGISSNIMSLTGIALAIGVIVDDGIVMVENAYRKLSLAQALKPPEPEVRRSVPGRLRRFFFGAPDPLNTQERIQLVEQSSKLVGPGVFYSTIVVITSFLPVFLLTGMEGKLFHPLAYTKTFILLVDAFLAITLAPVLIVFFLRGRLPAEEKNPVTRVLEKVYRPLLTFFIRWRKTTITLNVFLLAAGIFLLSRLGKEFMPPLNEGSLLFMPITLPDVSNSEAKRILQIQDKIIIGVPEVAQVLGKAGRANTATDNSPISMIETIILLKPQSQWRRGLTRDGIINELNARLQIPGVINGWTQPIINRINMLSTGIRTDVGIKVYGQNLDSIYAFSQLIKKELEGLPGIRDLYVEPITGGKYIDVEIRRNEIGRYGLSVDDVNAMVEGALGGMNISAVIDGRRRFPVNVRMGQDFRSSLSAIKNLPVQTMNSGQITLGDVADIHISEGAPMINSENALLRGTILFNVRGHDLGSTVIGAQEKLNSVIPKMPNGYFVEWSGQWENQLRANKTMMLITPIVLIIIFLVLYFTYRSRKEAAVTMITLPFAMTGGIVMVYFYGINLSVAVAVGFIALLGMAVETVMLMTIYLNESMCKLAAERGSTSDKISNADIREAIISGAVKRLRPVLMTNFVSLFGLVPILWSSGTGSDIMRPVTVPLIGGTVTAILYVLFVTPVVFEMMKERELRKKGKIDIPVEP